YVWIDSICIVQNDRDDWTKEAAIMGAIYENSLLTISATTAHDSTTGFLQKRRRRFKPIPLEHKSVNPNLNQPIVLRPWLQSWTKSVEGDTSPLSSRAWVLQERLLPPRTLHFGQERIFWERRRALVPEGDCYHDIDLKRRSYRRVAEASAPSPHSIENLHKTWFYIVQNYSIRNLTFQSDKFVAISGIARRMHALLGGNTYLVGLCRNDLLHGMLWTAARNGKRNSDYVAPSWSWA
ncbi:HET-domain-containing protein, partial [Setomelanomma holmii]